MKKSENVSDVVVGVFHRRGEVHYPSRRDYRAVARFILRRGEGFYNASKGVVESPRRARKIYSPRRGQILKNWPRRGNVIF